jgi:hypothetical protein
MPGYYIKAAFYLSLLDISFILIAKKLTQSFVKYMASTSK